MPRRSATPCGVDADAATAAAMREREEKQAESKSAKSNKVFFAAKQRFE